ncbi:MAG TPA: site-2 protease family protein [Thermoanaerobaculia bacterium]|nr:site-2 protease family protein [Thermoanaerobaculia bacterium]
MIHLGSIRKTSIDVDLSFLILVAFFVFSFYDAKQGIQYALLWVPVLFLSVLLHELAHAGMIGVFGYGASQVMLAGLGGVTLNKRVAKPWHDMVISAAGPAASFVIAFAASALGGRVHDPMFVAFLPLLAEANIVWGVFNLVPISPLDGGGIVRNFFRIFLRERTAFVIAIWISLIVGLAVIAFGVWVKYYMLSFLVAWYLWMNWQQWQYFRTHGFPGD